MSENTTGGYKEVVAEIKGDIERAADRMRDESLTEAIGPVEAVRRWAAASEIDDAEADILAAMTAELMEVQENG